MPRLEENLRALQQRIHAPLLAVTPYDTTPEAAARKLQLPDLIVAKKIGDTPNTHPEPAVKKPKKHIALHGKAGKVPTSSDTAPNHQI